MSFDPSRLYTILQNTRLQKKDNPLYQLLHSLIDATVSINTSVSSSSGGSVHDIINITQFLNPLVDESPNDDNILSAFNFNQPSFTQGSVIFAGPGGILAQNNTKLFWDNSTFQLHIGGVQGSSKQLEVSGANDAGIGLFGLLNPGNLTNENNLAAFMYTSAGNLVKIGAFAWLWGDTTDATGYATFNIHASYQVAGVQTDDVGYCQWGNNGIALWPADTTASSRPGSRVFQVNGTEKILLTGLVTTSTDGQLIRNTTAATGGVPVQISPRTQWIGTAWDGAASETVAFFAECLPANAGVPTGTWKLGYLLNGGALVYPLTVSSAGILTTLSDISVGGDAKITGAVRAGATQLIFWNTRSRMSSPADAQINFTDSASAVGFGFDVSTDAIAAFRVRAQNAYATVRALLYDTQGGGSTTISTGVGSVRMSTANPATNAAWIPLSYNGTTYFVPAWTTNAP